MRHRGWLLLAASLCAAVGFAAAGVHSLGKSAKERRESTLAAQIATGVQHQSALEWQARADRAVGAELQAELTRTRTEIERSFQQLARLEGGEIVGNYALYRRLVRLTDAELAFIAAGRIADAVELDESKVDPVAAKVTRRIREQTAGIAREASAVDRRSRRYLLGALLATLAVVLVLGRQFAVQRRLLREEQRLLTQLNAAIRQKDEFVATVSHELRTPLTSITGYAELLEEEPSLADEPRRWSSVIARNAERLQALVTDLLLVAELNAGTFRLEERPVDLGDLVGGSAEAAAPAASARGLRLEHEQAGDLWVTGDPSRLGQVVDNLLSNAIKFTPSGGSVVARAYREGSSAVLEVEDTGIGIEDEDKERLFERFFRSDQAIAEAIQGIGLGLAISKAIVDAHGGRVELSSERHVGTTFRVVLPAAPAPARVPVAA